MNLNRSKDHTSGFTQEMNSLFILFCVLSAARCKENFHYHDNKYY